MPGGEVVVARVVAPHGVHGHLRVEPFSDTPGRFRRGARLLLEGRVVRVQEARPLGRHLLLKLEGVETRQQAEALRHAYLAVPEEDIPPPPPDTYYHYQLLGMDVVTVQGEPLGRVVEVLSTGANDVYVVRGPEGEVLLPAVAEVVRQVDVAARRMVVDVPPGLR